jgi:penicillin-binding protein 1A
VAATLARVRGSRLGRQPWLLATLRMTGYAAIVVICLFAAIVLYVRFDRSGLPDMEAFSRFELPTIGHVYDANGRLLVEMASEYREITSYPDIPPVVRGAVLAAEDKNFFSHGAVDYAGFARVIYKLRIRDLLGRFTHVGRRNSDNNSAIFPHGGSTITQQLVRGYFLKTMTAEENSDQLRHSQVLARALSSVVGARTVNMMARKLEEIRLSLWVEREMRTRFGSKRRAKEEILARYISYVYMGSGQYGLAKGGILFWQAPCHVHR